MTGDRRKRWPADLLYNGDGRFWKIKGASKQYWCRWRRRVRSKRRLEEAIDEAGQ